MYICIPLGGIAIALGVYGDSHGWWDNRSFLTNLASSFASLLFGVPLALIVLTHLGAVQAEAATRKLAIRQARQALQNFLDTFDRGFAGVSQRYSVFELRDLRRSNRDLQNALRFASDATTEDERRITDAAVVLELQKWERLFTEKLSVQFERRKTWYGEVSQAWRRLDQEVRPRLEEVGVSWMRPDAHAALRQAVADLEGIDVMTRGAFAKHFSTLSRERGQAAPPDYLRAKMLSNLIQETEATHDAFVAWAKIHRWIRYTETIAS
ncbi:hypothetical protein ACWDXD_25135 [Streptomyces sp. NPDC003314]